jgi:hypothetical protein
MARTLRISKTDLVVLAEAQATMKKLYEDNEAVYFEITDDKAESTAEQTGGLLDMHE